MPTDKTDPSQSSSSSKASASSEKLSDSGVRTRQSEAHEHHYEPEAHHQWFPSEGFFFRWLIGGCAGFLCLFLALTSQHLLHPEFQVGEIAEHDIRAKHDTVVVDDMRTREAQDRARAESVPVFKPLQGAVPPADRLKAELNHIRELQANKVFDLPVLSTEQQIELLNVPDSEFDSLAHRYMVLDQPKQGATAHNDSFSKPLAAVRQQRVAIAQLKEKYPDLSDAEKVIAIVLEPAQLEKFSEKVTAAGARMNRVFSRLPIDERSILKDTAVEFLPDSWPEPLRSTTGIVVADSMHGSVAIDKVATGTKADKAASLIKPIVRQVKVNELIVKKGDTITAETNSTLQAMGMTASSRLPLVAGLFVSLAAAVALVALFLYTFEAKLLFSTRSIGLMYTIAIGTVLMAVAMGKTYPQAIPIPAAALLLAIFFGQRAAVAIVTPLIIFIAVDRLIDFQHLVALSTAAGAAIATYSKRRHALMSTGLLIGVAQAFGFLASLAVNQLQLTASELGSHTGMEFLGGLSSSIVAIGILPFLENIFGLVTPFRLAELTDADQPLLRRLEENAPGTYQHSLGVANLAEAGARAVGGDVNLVRAGAYYHDVGKMVRPKFFIENQLGATNPHDSMTPEQSRERVLAHVTDGLELAKKYSLPKAVQDFIPMHQGTSLMAYFYHKACLRDGVDNVDQAAYRYPGPKPQSKETCIVMLADVSEAVTHSMKDPSEEEVEAAITKVFQNRWDDNQFSESGMTYGELQRVRKAFVRVWRTLHHDRLKYPSTTTGRMPVVPSNLPTAATLAVTANEFPSGIPVVDESGTSPEPVKDPDKDDATKSRTSNGGDKGSPAVAKDSKSTTNGDKRTAQEIAQSEEEAIRDEGCC